MSLTLRQLTCVRETARRGSFNAAARALRLTQPAVSEQVRRLEDELGATLFHRVGRGVGLTAEGRVLLEHAERILAAADEARASVGRSARAGRALTLGMTRNAPHYQVEDIIAAAGDALPGVRLRLPGGNSSVVAQAVREGELDAAVVILPVEPRGLTVQPLFADEVLVVSADTTRAGHPVELSSLASRPLILYDASSGFADPTRRQLISRAQQAGLQLTTPVEVEQLETAVRLVTRGLGDTIAPSAATRQPWFPAELVTAPFAQPMFDQFALITRAGPEPTGAMADLIELVTRWGVDQATRARSGDDGAAAPTGNPMPGRHRS
jgi:DNA-binding transcriptional LysR family regulator